MGSSWTKKSCTPNTVPLPSSSSEVTQHLDPIFTESVSYNSDLDVELLFSVHERTTFAGKLKLDHNYVRLTYITTGGVAPVEFRSFMVELFKDEKNNNILRVKAEIEPRLDYKSEDYFLTKRNLKDVLNTAKILQLNRDKYNYFRNNCRHYTLDFFNYLKQGSTFELKFNPRDIDRYYSAFPRSTYASSGGADTTTKGYLSFSDLIVKFPLDSLEKEMKEKKQQSE